VTQFEHSSCGFQTSESTIRSREDFLAGKSQQQHFVKKRHCGSGSTVRELASLGVRASTVRLPPLVHGSGDRVGVPVVTRSAGHFGFLTPFVPADNPTSSKETQERLGWNPAQATLKEDLEGASYFAS
jgi:hypothetical protein